MNEQDQTPTPSQPATNKPDLYRIAVVVLLTGILVMQIIGQTTAAFSRVRSQKCVDAIALAEKITADIPNYLSDRLDQYEKDVYTDAENINQQMFRVQEYTFFALQTITNQQYVIGQIVMYCRQ